MDNNNIFKYLFAIVVLVLIGYTIYVVLQNNKEIAEYNLDQTSTLSNVQTDLRFAIAGMDTFNPIRSNNRNVLEITKIIYDPLVTLNENYKLQYCLAEEIAKKDDVTYIVKLRKGVFWENRENFTANDVKFTMDLILNGASPVYIENLRHVSNVEVIDSNTVQINLNEYVPFFEYNLTFPILPQFYYEGEDFFVSDKIPIGTGMFKISELSSNVIKLVPNELYWDVSRKPMATQISINLYGTIGEVYSAFKNGEIDIISVKVNNIEDYIGTLGYKKIEYKSRDYDFLAFNTANELLSDPVVRKALSLVIDRNSIVASCLGRGYTPSNFSLDMGCYLYTKDLTISSDTEQAAQILTNSGWERTSNYWRKREFGSEKILTFSLSINANNQTMIVVAEKLKEQFASFGVNVNIKYLSNENYYNALNNKEFECIIAGIKNGFSPNLNTFFGNNNLANYYTNEMADIMNTVNNSSDENVFYEKYQRLFDIYMEEAPYIGLYRNTDIIVYNQGLVGNITPNCFNLYHNIEKWYRQ